MKIKKNQYGISLIQILMVILLLLVSISYAFTMWGNIQRSNDRDLLANQLASEHYEFATALKSYIISNSYKISDGSVVKANDLIDSGFLPEKRSNGEANDGIDVMGNEIIGLVSSPFGFPQSASVFQKGEINKEIIDALEIKDDNILESIIRKASNRMRDLSGGELYTGVSKEDKTGNKIVEFSFSDEEIDLSEYFSESELNEYSETSLASLISMNIQPGYWVLRYKLYYPSLIFDDVVSNYQELTSLGYSENCPNDGFEVKSGFNPTFFNGPNGLPDVTLDETNPAFYEVTGDAKNIGDLSTFQYICLPASELITPKEQKVSINIDTNKKILGDKNLSCSFGSTEINRRLYSITHAHNFTIYDAEYSFILKSGLFDTSCQNGSDTYKIYYKGQFFDDHLPTNINIFENDDYKDYTENVFVQEIILK